MKFLFCEMGNIGYTQSEEDLDSMIAQFNKQKNRLKELRETKPDPGKNKNQITL